MFRDFTAKLTKKDNLAENVWQVTYEVIGEPVEFVAGQYHILVIGENFRQYSISSSDADTKSFEFLIAYYPGGVASDYLANLEIGAESKFRGPAGMFTYQVPPTDNNVVFLATGTGIGPIKSMITKALEGGAEEDKNSVDGSQSFNRSYKLFFGLKHASSIFLDGWLQEMAQKHANFTYEICLSREDEATCTSLNKPHIRCGRITSALENYWTQNDLTKNEYYICGSKDVVESVRDFVFNKGVPPENIHFENFG